MLKDFEYNSQLSIVTLSISAYSALIIAGRKTFWITTKGNKC